LGLVILLAGALFVSTIPTAERAEAAFQFKRPERKLAKLMNHERVERDRHKLRLRPKLTRLARRHSRAMAAEGTIFHSDLGDTVSGLSWSIAGENVGMGPSIRGLHNAFMESPGHRANVLERRYRRVGVGVVRSDRTIYVTVLFLG
jgi:uncharacterized protein YkwD